MYDEAKDVAERVSAEERDRLNFESKNFSLQPKKDWWELERELDEASTIEDILDPDEINELRKKGLLTKEQAEKALKMWAELSH